MLVLRILRIWLLFTVDLWSCGPSAVQPGRQYRRLRLLYISVKFIDVYSFESVPSFSSWNLTEECFVTKVVYHLIYIPNEVHTT
jgi:hypothetical protein